MKPDPVKFARAKRSLQIGLCGIIRRCEENIAMIGCWNANRLDESPFDAGGDIVTAKLARDLLAKVEAEEMIPDAVWKRFCEQVDANARPE